MNLKNLSVKNKIPKIFKKSLNNRKIDQIYKKFKKSLDIKKDFAVAVSGGSDSLSLAFLSKVYSIEKKLRAKFFIVDHRLRPESTNEAKIVRQALNKVRIKAEILTRKGKKPSSNIQSIARKERLKLLFKKCEKYKINNILLGHHEGDLVENFFIRMIRGSGGVWGVGQRRNRVRGCIFSMSECLSVMCTSVSLAHVTREVCVCPHCVLCKYQIP